MFNSVSSPSPHLFRLCFTFLLTSVTLVSPVLHPCFTFVSSGSSLPLLALITLSCFAGVSSPFHLYFISFTLFYLPPQFHLSYLRLTLITLSCFTCVSFLICFSLISSVSPLFHLPPVFHLSYLSSYLTYPLLFHLCFLYSTFASFVVPLFHCCLISVSPLLSCLPPLFHLSYLCLTFIKLSCFTCVSFHLCFTSV